MLRMDEINKIRKAHHSGESVNERTERFGRSWATVNNLNSRTIVTRSGAKPEHATHCQRLVNMKNSLHFLIPSCKLLITTRNCGNLYGQAISPGQ
jgi:hypothetical protein